MQISKFKVRNADLKIQKSKNSKFIIVCELNSYRTCSLFNEIWKIQFSKISAFRKFEFVLNPCFFFKVQDFRDSPTTSWSPDPSSDQGSTAISLVRGRPFEKFLGPWSHDKISLVLGPGRIFWSALTNFWVRGSLAQMLFQIVPISD